MAILERNPYFQSKLRPRRGFPKGFLDKAASVGGSSYYLNGEGIFTRIYVHNYFHLLSGGPFEASWIVDLYSPSGKRTKRFTGQFKGPETVVIDLRNEKNIPEFGVIHTRIITDEKTEVIGEPYTTTFFNEYYRLVPDKGIFAHSLGAPAAAHYPYERVSLGWMNTEGFRPHLLIASGCQYNRIGHSACADCTVTFVNSKKENREIKIGPLKTMACLNVDLFAYDPGMEAHLGREPYYIKFKGKNVLSKPYYYLSDGQRLLGEHT